MPLLRFFFPPKYQYFCSNFVALWEVTDASSALTLLDCDQNLVVLKAIKLADGKILTLMSPASLHAAQIASVARNLGVSIQTQLFDI